MEVVDEGQLGAWGYSRTKAAFAAFGPLPVSTVVGIVESVLSEREAPKSHVDLVWTGPHPRGSTARDTLVVMRELFRAATKEVLIAGFRFDQCVDLFRPLAEKAEAGVRVMVFLDVEGRANSLDAVEAFAGRAGEAFLEENWSPGAAVPELYFDPRTVDPSIWASLHAKCIVVDRARALVGSANFTDRGQTRNIELGVLVDDHRFSTAVVGHFLGGVSSGLFRRIEV